MSEADLKLATLHALERAFPHYIVQRLNSGKARRGRLRLCKPGTPDFLVLIDDGRCVWIEIKRDDKAKLRPEQVSWHERARRLGHAVCEARTVQQAIDAVTAAVRGGV